MLKGLIGKKIGMTQIFDDEGVAVPVTVIEAGPCYVTQVRLPERDGYSAVQLGFGEVKPKRLTGGQMGHLKRNSLPPLRILREFRVKDSDVNEGDKVTVAVLCRRRACGRDWHLQGQGLPGSCQALPLQGRPEDPWSVRPLARTWFARLGHHAWARL